MSKLKRLSTFGVFACLLFAGSLRASEHARTLHSPATVKGFIGGESHDSYMVHARAGQTMTVQLSWKLEHDDEIGDNHAEFWVGELPGFAGDGAVNFGKESDSGKVWTGKLPKTGNYYIYVMAYPTAEYVLKVTLR